ncbi:hypothetical protein HYW73_03835 [Candidatus Nomurabacteria bacterium]|nr:hypothetical protein [Candidatus Nomurabacteria bacterium]
MKKYLSFFAVLAMLFSFNVSAALAEENGGAVRDDLRLKREEAKKEWEAKRDTFRKEFEMKRGEAKAKMEALRASLKTERDAAKAKIKEARIVGREKALERFDGAVLRMTALKEKINSKITALKAKGVDTTGAEAFVATAETKIDEAKAKIAEANALFGTSIEKLSEENKTTLRTLTKETQALIKEAHKALGDAVKSLKDAVKAKIKAEKPAETDDSGETEN